ncbi:MAG: hypothetical protein A3D31_14565 [Candidatus Fluviicola riflensis]|nr:MAG: hypothetical protein CHH17_19000 [Candidatus Fluviicola riflensis]OGS78191.1 MAG: hypothetical protein A3D31_14565 [Candidatus Fluviicola riflensis]OGS85257.1 MAG: hypothetical protein A2724_11500 [Fluviicola sp. RIFCSPHIGHO2_01_FULL_43_53]OGS87299.1 MAG: hypothetical protein A3E30_07920 [Fluviicola sp. RIFCSPHIGHO2_12_FULL_43_24]
MNRVYRNAVFVGMVALVLSACSEPDTICACIESGDKLNQKANAILQKGSTKKDEQELQKLKADKQKKCAEFEHMPGPEMKKRMENCEE